VDGKYQETRSTVWLVQRQGWQPLPAAMRRSVGSSPLRLPLVSQRLLASYDIIYHPLNNFGFLVSDRLARPRFGSR